jgi:hypothetical protein
MAIDEPSGDSRSATESSPDDMVSQIVSSLERGVGFVRDNATHRAIGVIRAIVYGLLAAIVGVMLVALLAIVIVRVLYQLPGHRPWLAHGIAGLVFVVIGVMLMRRRRAPSQS